MKLGNRKKRREQYLLDVKVPTQSRLRQRLRWLAAVSTALVVVTLTCYGLYRLVKFSAMKMVYENPRFAIAQIIVDDDGALTPQQVVQLAGVTVGQNLFTIDLDQVRRNLEMVPLIRDVEVRRVLPQRLAIRINERIAVARLQVPSRELADALFVIDRSGVVMKPVKLADGTILQPQAPGSLPTLTSVKLSDVRVGRAVESEQIYRALELLDKLEQAVAGSMLEVESVDLSQARQLVLTTRQHTVVKFDVEDFQQQLRRLSAILAWAQQRQRFVQSVDLTVNRGVPVTFVN
ncbi:MAG TPA: FtsQ-type POTRA domain-containing protein [Verrucomicrobiae bacterium]|nr:FtsQ-type POTRA domain-containing protein [Verrucomicrobiae bacterium]